MELRPYTDADEPAVLALLAESLGWKLDEDFRALFRWKHRLGCFGPSAAWVACEEAQVVGFRAFMRWELCDASGDVVRAVRAVDTATAPSHRGRGLFSRLTMHGVECLTDDGVAFVFNTPNDQSRPGYLKMGWEELGRLPLRVRFLAVTAPLTTLRARVPSDLWSQPVAFGVPAAEVLDDAPVLDELLARLRNGDGYRTARSARYLRWRYVEGPMAYRALVADSGVSAGALIFRARRRGPATEVVLDDILAPTKRVRRQLVRRLLDAPGHHVVGAPADLRGLPLAGLGPILTWRALAERRPPGLADFAFSLGDIELF